SERWIRDRINANTLGWIVSFMHRVSIMSAGLEAVNPFINNSIKNFNINLIKKVSKIIKGEK
ncbi:glucose-6-phosphate isomerase, partial [Metamycoplasma hyosynoviae]|nr:glucose-6-phosphate isomerase [Metamycoplasma hyosynoviae]